MRRLVGSSVALALVATALVVGSGVGPAHACSCVATTDEQAFDSADAVFVGRMVERRAAAEGPIVASTDPVTLVFEVSDVFKGKVAERQEVVTASGSASCGLDVLEQDEYLIFGWLDSAFGSEAQPAPGQLSVSLCGGSRPADDPLDVEGVRGRAPRAEPADDVEVVGLVRIDEVRTGTSPRKLVVGFVGAPKTPKGTPCWEGYRARVMVDEIGVHLTVRRLREHPPVESLVACSDVGAARTITVTLRAPLGDRTVYDGSTGEPVG